MASRTFTCALNGAEVVAQTDDHETLLEVLRDRFGITSVRESCGQGLCGSCTVVVDDRAVSSCLTLAALADGSTVMTAEGLPGVQGQLHPVAQAFIDAFAFQCGFCTPGMVMMASELLRENPDPSEEEIRRYLAGNLCRCGAYPEIIEAVKEAAEVIRTRTATSRATDSSHTPSSP